MDTKRRIPAPARIRRAAAAGAVLLAVALLGAAPASAGRRHPRAHRHAGPPPHARVHRVPVVVPHRAPVWRPVVVPRVLVPRAVVEVAPYRSGRVWYGPHRHRHELYRFPVVVGGVRTWRTEAYCGGRLVPDAHVTIAGPRFSLHVAF